MKSAVKRFVELRKRSGLTQTELAEKMGWTSMGQFISNVERGVCLPPKQSFRELAKTLKTDTSIFADMAKERLEKNIQRWL